MRIGTQHNFSDLLEAFLTAVKAKSDAREAMPFLGNFEYLEATLFLLSKKMGDIFKLDGADFTADHSLMTYQLSVRDSEFHIAFIFGNDKGLTQDGTPTAGVLVFNNIPNMRFISSDNQWDVIDHLKDLANELKKRRVLSIDEQNQFLNVIHDRTNTGPAKLTPHLR
jgi:hypothetical protein